MLGRLGHDPRALAAGNAVSLALALLRNVAIARLIGPEQFGIAATLMLIALFFDAISETGLDRYVIQSREGDEPRVQHTAQAMMIVRGSTQALLMIAAAVPLSWFFNTPTAASGYMWLGLVPFLAGLVNLDSKRAQRAHDFGPEIVMVVVAELVTLVVAVATALALRDFHAALYGLIARSLTLCLLSHLLAKRRYALAWSRGVVARIVGFGWPLLLSSLVIFVAMQSDRAMISALLGPYALGLYSAAAMLTLAPVNVTILTFSRLILPRMARVQDDPVGLRAEFDQFKAAILPVALLCCIGFACFGPTVGLWLFGEKYRQAPEIFALLGFLQSVRLLYTLPTNALFAIGRTKELLSVHVVRLLSLPLGFALFAVTGALAYVVVGFVSGELIALAWAFFRYANVRGEKAGGDMSAVLTLLATMGVTLAVLPFLEAGPLMPVILFVALIVILMLLLALFQPRLVKTSWALVRQSVRRSPHAAPAAGD